MSADDSTDEPRWFARSTRLDSPPPGVNVRVEFGATSERGSRQPQNDDHYLIMRVGRNQETVMSNLPDTELPPRFDEFAYAMIVADGLGRAGGIASRLAITTFVNLAVYFGRWNVRIDEPTAEDVMKRAERFYRDIDSALVQASKYRPTGLQTTLTAVYTAGDELFFAHVGHSRAYLFRKDELLQLTHDHTLTGDGPSDATSTDVLVGANDRHQPLTEAIGRSGASGPRIDVERVGLVDGDVILLCTNGLTDAVDNARIAQILRSHQPPDHLSRDLVKLAIESGGGDDATALVASYAIPG
jgi:serine/threonine protein phosphatase PrpC